MILMRRRRRVMDDADFAFWMSRQSRKKREEHMSGSEGFMEGDEADAVQTEVVADAALESGPKPFEPDPVKLEKVHGLIRNWLDKERQLFELVDALEDLLPEDEAAKPLVSEEMLRRAHLGEGEHDKRFALSEAVAPPNVCLVMLDEAFRDQSRYERVDPNSLPLAVESGSKLRQAEPDSSHITLGAHQATVPDAADLWLVDKATGVRFIAQYGQNPRGFIVSIRTKRDNKDWAVQLLKDLKDSIHRCRYIKGEVLEVYSGGFKVLEGIGEQEFPVISKALESELEKNVTNMFSREGDFRRYGLPVKRAVILQGSPGCGKTMVCRWLTKKLKGKVTVFWVTSKSIQNQVDVSAVFEAARKLSPSMIVMEDMDLISGTRQSMLHNGNGALGELLNQLDGLDPNESLVVVATTNEVNSLDKALADRPGRFDRIYRVGLPDAEAAEAISRKFLLARGISQEVVDSIAYEPVKGGNLSGAQVVEVMKGAIFEAVHARGDVTSLHVHKSYKGLEEQRKMVGAQAESK